MTSAEDVEGVLAELAAHQHLLVAHARAAGVTWAEIAAALGVTVQAAHKRYRTARRDPVTERSWREPPLPM